jgi:hypothetical protein
MGLFDIFTGDPGREAADANRALYQGLETKGLGYLDTALPKSEAALGASKATLAGLGSKYGAGSQLYLNALGVNGPEGTAAAQGAFTTSPGYQFARDEGLNALDRRAAAAGGLSGGNASADAIRYATGYAGQEYGNWMNNLKATINPEVTGVTGAAGADAATAGLYQTDAANRIGLGNVATAGQAAANKYGADAEMGGSGNLWNFGLNLAKLGTGTAGRYG